jgi:hypothetical protein
MAKLADAADLKSAPRKRVPVRFRLSAPRTRSSEVELAAHNRSVHGSIPCGSTNREVAPYHRRKPNRTEPKGRKSEDDDRVHLFPSSSGKDTALSRRGQGFDSPWERHAAVAQMAEHLICNHVVAGSIPASGSIHSLGGQNEQIRQDCKQACTGGRSMGANQVLAAPEEADNLELVDVVGRRLQQRNTQGSVSGTRPKRDGGITE